MIRDTNVKLGLDNAWDKLSMECGAEYVLLKCRESRKLAIDSFREDSYLLSLYRIYHQSMRNYK